MKKIILGFLILCLVVVFATVAVAETASVPCPEQQKIARGAKGPRGPQGIRGPAGLKGPQGEIP